MSDNQNSERMSSIEGTYQSINSCEIKQEPAIKEEPLPAEDLEEFPALNNCGDGHLSVDLSRIGDEANSLNLSIARVKIEIEGETCKKNKKPSKSNICNANKSFNQNVQRKALKQHQCKQCEYNAKYKSYLEKHLVKHTGKRPFHCSHRAKAFKSKQSLKNHMKAHVEDFLFSCAIFLKGFDQKNDKIKNEINCKTLRYECHLCKMSIGLIKSHLIQHMRTHSGEKPFECKECFKQFTQIRSLNVHMKLHAGPHSFHCSRCRQEFSRENKMIDHQQTCNRRVYECYVCGKSFGSKKGNLKRHMCTHTGDKPFECNQCRAKFTQKNHLNQHILIHLRSLPWKCAICRQGFAKQTQWKAHQLKCHRRVYECFDCNRFFDSYFTNLRNHMTKHSSEKPFRCEKCGNRFTWKSSLTRHIKSIHMLTKQ